jgi:TIGR03009 family protein
MALTGGGRFARAQQSTPPGRRPAQPPAASPQILVRPQTARNAGVAPPAAAMPPGFPLDPAKQERVDQILKYWEHHTADIATFECKFVRRNFDFVFGSKETPRSIDYGTIRYKSPDKGLMRVDKVYNVNPQAADPKEQLVQQDVQFGEYWVCDGQSVYQFDARTKVLTESRLPTEMRGKAIAEGPLPFMFGAKADTMKGRYWIREVTPQDNPQGEYFLEATPKRQEDAANFDVLWVRLARSAKGQLFPRAMRMYNKQGYVQYEFQDHSLNNPLHRLQAFMDSFVSPKTPSGWTKVLEDWSGNRIDDRQAAVPERPTVPPKSVKQR